ncbi:MAG: F0F1 ATP synthase subunit gamma [Armatimonadota bacterium]|nr:F0F1 ATP synthase subunit gamma [Armatimonadota bacterium]
METVESLRDRIDTAESLQSVVTTMKALAAVNIQQLEGVVRSLDRYHRTVELGLQVLLSNRPEGVQLLEPVLSASLGMIVLGSDQGMCGQFNEDIVSRAVEDLQEMEMEPRDRAILAIGLRTVGHLEDAGLAVDDYLGTPASPGSITPVVEQIALHVERWRSERGFDRVFLYYNERVSSGHYRPAIHRLLPIDRQWLEAIERRRWPSRVLPTFSMPWRPLFSRLMQQHLLVTLYRAVVESMISEHTARMASMQAAERNIDERLEELRGRFRQTRQSSITAELLDIISGFEALRTPRDL